MWCLLRLPAVAFALLQKSVFVRRYNYYSLVTVGFSGVVFGLKVGDQRNLQPTCWCGGAEHRKAKPCLAGTWDMQLLSLLHGTAEASQLQMWMLP
jgi:hypothetical protein